MLHCVRDKPKLVDFFVNLENSLLSLSLLTSGQKLSILKIWVQSASAKVDEDDF